MLSEYVHNGRKFCVNLKRAGNITPESALSAGREQSAMSLKCFANR
jgi:hypothetical protein